MSEDTLIPIEQYYDPSYNPRASLLTYESIYNHKTTVSFKDIEEFINTKITQGVFVGTKIGAAGLAILVLWMVSKNRKTPIFLINQVSLFLTLTHSSLYLKNLLGHFSSVTFAFTLFPQYISNNDLHVYAATNMFQVFLVAAIEVSLIFQVRVIFRADNYKRVGTILTSISTVLGITTVVLYLVTAINSIKNVYYDVSKTSDAYYFNISTILMACSVNFMTLLLTVKLILAIRSRRFLGLKQFDSFHILLIMSTQTLLCPSVLYILAYALSSRGTDSLTTIATLLVTLSLPLSSMWATSANNSTKPSSINTQFSPYNCETMSFGTGSSTYYANSMNSNKRSITNKLYDLYPANHFSCKRSYGSGEDNTIVDIEKKCFNIGSSIESSPAQPSTLNNGTSSHNKSVNGNVEVQTPTTAAEEDAKRFWTDTYYPTGIPDEEFTDFKVSGEQCNIFQSPTSKTRNKSYSRNTIR
ncbi:alpha-factor pheromone receptor STE2 Ecym_1466 [Eremothecium cymbalariae DBVPG|uniref:Pheromone alpha factor receptor n=2 Tax=Eremothecium cymbalariae TaxID=45285 RepID=G8JMH5_ERECY|nr:hypothetical protein Ecym_1466 [Eremothecium cymbalariae DBVPG\